MNKIYGYLAVISLLYPIYYGECVCDTLDLLNYEKCSRRFNLPIDNTAYYQYVPHFNKKVIKVVEGDKVIWERSTNVNKCLHVTAYLLSDDMHLIKLRLSKADGKDDYKYYMRYNDGWIETVASIFDEKLRNLLRLYVLDITKDDRNILSTYDYSISGNRMTVFYSITAVITKVVEGNLMIWSRDELDLECTSVNLYTRKNIHLLICLALTKRRHRKEIYFRKVDDEWKSIDKKEYEHLVSRVMCEVTLDISNMRIPNSVFNTVHNNTFEGMPSIIFTPKYKYLITEIVDEDFVIWKGDFEKCTCPYGTLYHQGETRFYLQIHFDDGEHHGDLYFVNANPKWKPISDDEFYEGIKIYDEQLILIHNGWKSSHHESGDEFKFENYNTSSSEEQSD